MVEMPESRFLLVTLFIHNLLNHWKVNSQRYCINLIFVMGMFPSSAVYPGHYFRYPLIKVKMVAFYYDIVQI